MPPDIGHPQHELTDQKPSSHRRIAVGFLWLSMFVLTGKLIGAAKEMAIAWRYGVSANVDAYVFVFNLINWPISIWFSILTVVLVPLVTRLRASDAPGLNRFRSELLALTLIAGALLTVVYLIGLPWMLKSGSTNLTGPSREEALTLIGPLSALLPLGLLIGLLSAWTIAGGHHRNTLLEAMPALAILIAVVAPSDFIPQPLIWGTITGFALHTLALWYPLRGQDGFRKPSFKFQSEAWRGFLTGVGIIALGQILNSMTGIVDQFIAASLPEGALSTLSYANRILALILGMGATAIGRATLPIFSQARAEGKREIYSIALKWALWMFLGGIVVAILGALTSKLIVALLFERGAFTQENTRAVAKIFTYSLIQVPFYFSALVLVSVLSSTGHYSFVALSGASNLLFKLVFTYLLTERFQLIGLVLSTSAMYALSMMFLYIFVRFSAAREDKNEARNS